MKTVRIVAVLVLVASTLCFARDIKVAADGSGDFKTVQAAADAIPEGNTERVVISIQNGTYNEEVRIHRSFVTLRGEDRKLTKITALVDSSACKVEPGQSVEEHCATVIADGTDIVVENLTVENSYKGEKGKGAALTFMGDSTRIALWNVDVIGFGGDTLGLTARRSKIGDGGEYYLNNVYVSGTYHIIVPRGNTYFVNGKFVCYGGSGKYCLFAEGITRERDKLVIRSSTFEATDPFKLGSYFRDAAWYFVDDTFPATLRADGEIHRDAAQNYEMKWGKGRVYFAGNKGPDYPWLKDNIEQSPAKRKENVTAAWALPEWNPESTAAPTVKAIEPLTNGIRVVFSQSVTVRGTPFLKMASCTAGYSSGSGTEALTFVSAPNGGCGTQSRVKAIKLNGGAIFGSAASLKERNAYLKLPR
jgi:hypothetical protein